MKGKRIMGLPVVVWLGVAAAGLLLGIYLRRRGASSTDVGSQTSYPLSVPGPISQPPGSVDNAVAGGGLSPVPDTGVDPTVWGELLTNEQSMIGILGSMADSVGQLAFNVGSSGGSGASGSGAIPQPMSVLLQLPDGFNPGGVNQPADTPVQTATTGPAKNAPAPPRQKTPTAPAKVKAAPPSKSKPVHYYTYKKNVPLAHGQTLHFLKGHGYYAA